MMSPQMLAGLIDAATQQEPCAFSCSITWAGAAVVGTNGATNAITIPAGQHFFCTAMRAVMRSDATGRVMMADDNDGATETGGWGDAPALIQVQNTGNNRFLFDSPVDARLWCPASADSETTLPKAWYVAPQSQIAVSATILKVPAAAVTLRVSLIGFRVFAGI